MIYDFTKLKNNLQSKGYTVSVFATKEAATEYKNGEIIQIGSSQPSWLRELMEYVI